MARVFNGSSQYLQYGGIPGGSASVPLTFACWFNSTNVTSNQSLIYYTDPNGHNRQSYALSANGNEAGDTISCNSQNVGGTNGLASTTSGYIADTWHHAAGVFAATNDRRAYLDGGSKGTSTTNIVAASADTVSIGVLHRTSGLVNYFSGSILWPAIWNVALTDDEVASLAAGAHPTTIRPDALVFFAPLGGFDGNHDIDIVGGLSLTAANSPTWSDDSPSGLIYPSVPVVGIGTAGGGGGFGAYLAAASRSSRTLCGSRL